MTAKEMGPASGASLAGPFYARRAGCPRPQRTVVVTAMAKVLTDGNRE
jgi:hypothetical protein